MTATAPPQAASGDQHSPDTQTIRVAAGPHHLADQAQPGTHSPCVGEAQNSASSQQPPDTHARRAAGPQPLADQGAAGTHDIGVGEAPNPDSGHRSRDTQEIRAAVGPTSPATKAETTPSSQSSSGTQSSTTDHRLGDTQICHVGGAPDDQQGPATREAMPTGPALDLADPFLALAADVLDDLERVRVANENRLRQLTRTAEDKDGEERGFGLTVDHPDVACLAALVDALVQAEQQAVKNLERRMKQHPLGPWVKQAKGVGAKQAARLLAAVGDPYWNDLHDRPRTVSELWAYCGYHVVHPDGQHHVENQTAGAVGVAPFRRKGVKANWSDDAKKRCFLVAKSILKAGGPYRAVYDQARVKYADAVHQTECKRCGPSGKPAQAGSPLSAGHQHARGLRAVSKAVLRDLWCEAARLHELPIQRPDDHRNPTGERRWMGSALPDDHNTRDTQAGDVVGDLNPSPSTPDTTPRSSSTRRRRNAAPDSPEGGVSP
jgi:hypothetical protein